MDEQSHNGGRSSYIHCLSLGDLLLLARTRPRVLADVGGLFSKMDACLYLVWKLLVMPIKEVCLVLQNIWGFIVVSFKIFFLTFITDSKYLKPIFRQTAFSKSDDGICTKP